MINSGDGVNKCIDCKYCSSTNKNLKVYDYMCYHIESFTGEEDNITGRRYKRTCEYMRTVGKCKEEGVLFEKRITWSRSSTKEWLIGIGIVLWFLFAMLPALIMLGLMDKSWLMGLMK